MGGKIDLPAGCGKVWRALNGTLNDEAAQLHRLRDGWFGAFDLQQLTRQSCADRKARLLREAGLVESRDQIDHQTGGKFVQFRVRRPEAPTLFDLPPAKVQPLDQQGREGAVR